MTQRTSRRGAVGQGLAGLAAVKGTVVLGRVMVGLLSRGEPSPGPGRPSPPAETGVAPPAAGPPAATAAAVHPGDDPAVTVRGALSEAVAVAEIEPAPAVPVDHVARADAPTAPSLQRGVSWGWLSALFLIGAVGLLVMTAGNALSRIGRSEAEWLFWAGFLLIVVPVTARLLSRSATRVERGLLVVGVGLLLYATKVLHDPFAFVYSDELVHLRNAEDVLRAGGLFPQNSILPVTVYYPGLATITAGLAALTGLGSFGAGLIVIGVARLILTASLFLIFERITGSARIAGLAGMVYVANPNFLFWSGQYSYQSLALPLAALAVLALVQRRPEDGDGRRFGWMLLVMVTTVAVVMTHHLTAYALVALFVLMSITAAVGLGRRHDSAWGYALFGAVAVVTWLLQVAPLTGDYLGSIFEATYEGVLETVQGSSEPRQLFTSEGGQAAPSWERFVGLGSVALIGLMLPFGLWQAWRRRHRSALLVVCAVGAAAYLAILPLRLVPSAWETANRTSDFLFLGIGLTVALAAARIWRPGRLRRVLAPAMCVFIAVIAVGGAVAGWPPDVRLSQPYRATVAGHEIEPQGVALAEWSLTALGPDRRFAADESNGRLLLGQGLQLPYIGRDGRARLVLEPLYGVEAVIEAVNEFGIAYAVVDRRNVATDNLAGYFFAPAGTPRIGTRGLLPADQLSIVDLPSTDRLFDSGDVVVFDVRRIEQ